MLGRQRAESRELQRHAQEPRTPRKRNRLAVVSSGMKNTQARIRKIAFTRETVRNLDAADLRVVAGGITWGTCSLCNSSTVPTNCHCVPVTM
jgi:hypothetical protein